jgi:hypothetical protein
VAVALDVAVLAADDEEDERLVAGVRHLAWRRRVHVQEPARPQLAHFPSTSTRAVPLWTK